MADRSLNVLKRTEKGLLTGCQRSFSFWKKSSATEGAALDIGQIKEPKEENAAGPVKSCEDFF
jgi:hypothetical protein